MFYKTVISLVLYEIFTGHQRKMISILGFIAVISFLQVKCLPIFFFNRKYKNLGEIYLLLLSQKKSLLWSNDLDSGSCHFGDQIQCQKYIFSFYQKGGVLVPSVFFLARQGFLCFGFILIHHNLPVESSTQPLITKFLNLQKFISKFYHC